MPRLEIIASTLEDALNALAGGADSLELCIALEQDGLTPPLDIVKAIRDKVDLRSYRPTGEHRLQNAQKASGNH